MPTESNGSNVDAILSRYAEPLLRAVADRFLKPRSTWPVDDLRQKCVEGLQNPIMIDRRMKELPDESRKILRLVRLSGQSEWRIDHLLQLLACLDHVNGLQPVQSLLEAGLAFPILPDTLPYLRSFEEWLGIGGMLQSRIWIPTGVSERTGEIGLGLPKLEAHAAMALSPAMGDGWEWPIRIAAAWQKLDGTTVKVAQTGTYYKRELTKLQSDAVLNSPFAVPLVSLPEPGVLSFSWARLLGLFRQDKTEIVSQGFGESWKQDLPSLLRECLAAFFCVIDWNPTDGYSPEPETAALPSIALISLLLIADVQDDGIVSLDSIQKFIEQKHPEGKSSRQMHAMVRGLVMGVFLQLRIVEIFNTPDEDFVRLSDLGRWLLRDGKKPDLEPHYTQTLTVQPNGEIILFRQHLRVTLLAELTQFAVWKTIGAACTLEIDPERMYRGLEAGLSFSQIVQTLEKFGMYPLPGNVRDSINRWASKRERVTVYASATLIEFVKPEELEDAYRRGLVAQKLTDRIGLSEKADIDYKNFRLLGNRDYESPPQPCVEFDEDGLTFDVISAKADLLLEAELKQIADPLPFSGNFERRRYRFTLERFRKMADSGWTRDILDRWCRERSGDGASPAASLLFLPPLNVELRAEEKLVIEIKDEAMADGLTQWPATARLIEARLGPNSITVSPHNLSALREQLKLIGITL